MANSYSSDFDGLLTLREDVQFYSGYFGGPSAESICGLYEEEGIHHGREWTAVSIEPEKYSEVIDLLEEDPYSFILGDDKGNRYSGDVRFPVIELKDKPVVIKE